MKDLDDLISEVSDELGIDAYHLYGGGRHFAVEGLILHFALACVFAYAAGLIGAEDLGKKHRKKFKDFLSRVRSGTDSIPDLENENARLKDETQNLLASATSKSEQNEMTARTELQGILEDSGMPNAQAQSHAEVIADTIQGRGRTDP